MEEEKNCGWGAKRSIRKKGGKKYSGKIKQGRQRPSAGACG
jgi:hypothetical protein